MMERAERTQKPTGFIMQFIILSIDMLFVMACGGLSGLVWSSFFSPLPS
jgi:hypothetical protein